MPGREACAGTRRRRRWVRRCGAIRRSIPGGAVTGKVMDSDMAAKMSFIGRAGHPCGEDFLAGPFLAAHPEFAWQKPILHDMKAGPWTVLSAGAKEPAVVASR